MRKTVDTKIHPIRYCCSRINAHFVPYFVAIRLVSYRFYRKVKLRFSRGVTRQFVFRNILRGDTRYFSRANGSTKLGRIGGGISNVYGARLNENIEAREGYRIGNYDERQGR